MLSLDRHFFEVPIYRCSPEQHLLETECLKARLLEPIQYQKTSNPENFHFFEQLFDSRTRYTWDFNEIVGYIRLYPLGTQIRGELWFMKAKRLRRGMKKKLRWIEKAFELNCSPSESNADIGSRVLARVNALENEAPCQGRYIDTLSLSNVASFLDWGGLLGFPQQKRTLSP